MAVRRRPKRAPGQHFLRSNRLSSDLVHQAGVERGDLVVEIGAGSGMLTRALAETGADVLALELDPDLASVLRRRFAARANVTVVEADAFGWRWPSRPFAFVANLPFHRSGAILSHLLRDPRVGLRRADVIVQWELAVKHAAVWPATLRGTYWRAWYELSTAGRLAGRLSLRHLASTQRSFASCGARFPGSPTTTPSATGGSSLQRSARAGPSGGRWLRRCPHWR